MEMIVLMFIMVGIPLIYGRCIYHIALKFKKNSWRNIFFVGSCSIPLAIIIIGNNMIESAKSMTEWDWGQALIVGIVLYSGIFMAISTLLAIIFIIFRIRLHKRFRDDS